MSTEIRPEVDLALRKQIERAVRPVRAGKDRKLAMREELLGHLTTIYTEELQRQPDDQAAMAAALERFGEPAALTTELNASVGSAERSAYHVDRWEDAMNRGLRYWFSRREGEPWFRLALRSLFALTLLNPPLCFGIPLFFIKLINGWQGDLVTLSQLSRFAVLLLVSEVVTIFATWHMLRTVEARQGLSRWILVCVHALLWSVFAAAFTVPFRWSLAGSLPTAKEIADVAVSFSVVLSPFFVFGVWCMNFAKQYRKKLELWTKLAIDD
jgi:hypothetical protein